MTRWCFMLLVALAVSVYISTARDVPRENKDTTDLGDQKNAFSFGETGGFPGFGNNGLPMGGMGMGVGVGGDFGGDNGIGGVGAGYHFGGAGGPAGSTGTFGGLGSFDGLPIFGGGGFGGSGDFIGGGGGGAAPSP